MSFTLLILSYVCFYSQPDSPGNPSLLSEITLHTQDTTTIEYWQQEAKKWKIEAEDQRNRAESNGQVAIDNMTLVQRYELEANKQRAAANKYRIAARVNGQEAEQQRNLASKMAEEARLQHNKAEDWKFLYYNLVEAFEEIDSVFRDFAKQVYEDEKHLKGKVAELEKVFEDRMLIIERLKKNY